MLVEYFVSNTRSNVMPFMNALVKTNVLIFILLTSLKLINKTQQYIRVKTLNGLLISSVSRDKLYPRAY